MGAAKSKGAGPGAGPPPPPPPARAAADAGPEGLGGRRANRVMVTRDGRHLSFAEAGDPAGFPVLCFFGVGSSRYLVLLFDDAARRLGLRVIACDRPGFGRSSPAAGGGFAAFARDVEALCATLRLRRVALWGHSVGCAYVAACALLVAGCQFFGGESLRGFAKRLFDLLLAGIASAFLPFHR